MKIHYTQNTKGFTLVETLVAMFIFLLAFTALSQVSTNSLQDINITKKKLTAQYLAEEGVEYVKYVQKLYIANGQTQSDFVNTVVAGCEGSGSGCDFYFNPSTNTVEYIPVNGERLKLYEHGTLAERTSPSLYPISTYVDSDYYRQIMLSDFSSQDTAFTKAVKVEVTVFYDPNQNPIYLSHIIYFPL